MKIELVAISAAVALMLPEALCGATCVYTGGGSDSKWSTAANWVGGSVPQSGDAVIVSNTVADAVIEIDSAWSLASLTIDGPQSLSFSGNGSVVLSGSMVVHAATSFGEFLSLSFTASSSQVSAGVNPSNSGVPLTLNCPVQLASTVTSFAICGKSAVSFNGDVTGTSAKLCPATGVTWSPNGIVTFNGVVKVKKVEFRSHTSQSEFVFNAVGNEWESSEVSYGCITFGCAGACPKGAVLSWNNWSNSTVAPNYCSYCFKGFDQTADRLGGVAAGNYDGHFINPNTYWAENSKSSTLTLLGSASAQTDAKLIGKLSVVWAPGGDFTQDFIKRAHTMSGAVVVSNGTFKISQGASFANVGKVAVEGGTLEFDGAADGAFAAATNVSIGAEGCVKIDTGANSPFTASTAVLSLAPGAKLAVPAGVHLAFKSATLGGSPLAAWTYTGESGSTAAVCDWIDGSGTVEILSGAAGSAVWIGGGADDLTTTDENWLNGDIPGVGSTVVFSPVVDGQALLAREIAAGNIEFAASAPRTFTVENDASTPSARLLLGGDITFSGDAAQTNTISCPVLLMPSALSWTLGGPASLLSMSGTVTGATAPAAVTVTANGGTCRLDGMLDYSGTFTLKDGGLVLSGDSIGADISQVTVEGSERATTVIFNGGEYSAPVTVGKKSGSGWASCTATFAPNTTNEFAGVFRVADTWHNISISVNDRSAVVFGDGLSHDNGTGYSFMYNGSYASIVVEGAPIGGNCSQGVTLTSWSGSNEFVLSAPGNSATGPFSLVGPVRLRTTCDWAFSSESGAMMPFAMKVNGGHKGSIFDLCGHSQAIGRIVGGADQDATAVIMSESPATLHVYQSGTELATTSTPIFAGAVSLSKHGDKELVLAGANTTTGGLEVVEGTLSFVGAGSWTEGAEVTVAGGVLKIDSATRLARNANYRLCSGKIDLASGVRIRARSLTVSDGSGGYVSLRPGVYGRSTLGDFIAGDGEIVVSGGMLLQIR